MSQPDSDPLLQPGTILEGKYRLERVLGEGGMGIVLQAHHLQLDERVAIKLPRLEAAANPEAVRRFLREARVAVKIKSEHVARVNDVGTLESGQPFIVMEFLEGIDLAAWLQTKGVLSVDQAVEFVLQACEALAEAHALGMVHRDLKPANLFCTQRRDGSHCIKVLDFGISKLGRAGSSTDANITVAGVVMGSPLYMSPEQLQSTRDVDERSDIWSMGVVLYELLSGKLPFEADTLMGLGVQIAHSTPASIRSVRYEVPGPLEHVVFHCLEKDRAQRYANVAELARALYEFAPARARASVERIALVLKSGEAQVQANASTLLPGVDSIPPDQLPLASTRQSGPNLGVAPVPAVQEQTQAPRSLPLAGTTSASAAVSSDSASSEAATSMHEVRADKRLYVWALAALGISALAVGAWFVLTPGAPHPSVLVAAPLSTAAELSEAALSAASSGSNATALPITPAAGSIEPGALASSAPAEPLKTRVKQPNISPVPQKPKPQTSATEPAQTPRDCSPPYNIDERGNKRFKPECF